MRISDGVYLGYVRFGIGHTIIKEPGIITQFKFCMITSIDSEINLCMSSISRKLRDYNICFDILGESLVIPTEFVPRLKRELNFFTGYDEIWFFDHEPTIEKPRDFWIVGPTNLAADESPLGLVSWVQQSGCKLGLGDGEGLNYVAAELPLARIIETLDIAA